MTQDDLAFLARINAQFYQPHGAVGWIECMFELAEKPGVKYSVDMTRRGNAQPVEFLRERVRLLLAPKVISLDVQDAS